MRKYLIVASLWTLSLGVCASNITLFGESSKDGYKYFEFGYFQILDEMLDFRIKAGGAKEDGVQTAGNIGARWGISASDFFCLGIGGKYIQDTSTFSPGIGAQFDFTFTISQGWKGTKYTDLIVRVEYMSFGTALPRKRMGQTAVGLDLIQEFTSWLSGGVALKKFNYSLDTTAVSSSFSARKISSKIGGMDGYPEIEKSLFFDLSFFEKWKFGFSYNTTRYLELGDDGQNTSVNVNYQLSKEIALGLSFVRVKETSNSNLVGLEFNYNW